MDGFKFFRSYYNVLKRLSVKERGVFITKMLEYMFENKDVTFTEKEEKLELAWLGIEANLISSKNKSRKTQTETK